MQDKHRIYHLCTHQQWQASERAGLYKPPGFEAEGFIHCSHPAQLVKVANRRFRGQTDLVVLVIDTSRVRSRIVEENVEGGEERFPHIYGGLAREAVIESVAFPCRTDGTFELPAKIR